VRLLNIIKAENNKDLYMVFDFMETDLHAVIVSPKFPEYYVACWYTWGYP